MHYTCTQIDRSHDYRVPIVRTRPHYGGVRFWFICPATGRRVAKLYLHPGGDLFASRQAYRLSYGSQSETVRDSKWTHKLLINKEKTFLKKRYAPK